MKRLGEAVASLKIIAPDDEHRAGAVITAQHLERVAGFVERAKALPHVQVVTGGEKVKGPGYYFQPTLLAGAPGRMDRAARGVRPVVTVTPFDDEEQVLAQGKRIQLRAGVVRMDPRRGPCASQAPACNTAAHG